MKSIRTCIVISLIAVAGLLLLKMSVAREGYNTWEAVRNRLIRDGQISVELDGESTVTGVWCNKDFATGWEKNRATVKAGYEWDILISVQYRKRLGEHHQVMILTDKPNNWGRIRFIQSRDGQFRMFMNGIEQNGGFTVVLEGPCNQARNSSAARRPLSWTPVPAFLMAFRDSRLSPSRDTRR